MMEKPPVDLARPPVISSQSKSTSKSLNDCDSNSLVVKKKTERNIQSCDEMNTINGEFFGF